MKASFAPNSPPSPQIMIGQRQKEDISAGETVNEYVRAITTLRYPVCIRDVIGLNDQLEESDCGSKAGGGRTENFFSDRTQWKETN